MRIGIDLGGTKIEAQALGDDGQLLFRQRVATPQGDYLSTVLAIRELVLAAESQTGQRGTVGVGIPGSPSPRDGLIRNANSVCLNGQPLQRDLGEALAREVRIANDANCLAVSEATDGAGAGAAMVFGVILGTGVGGGIAHHGRVWAGSNGIAGEWGHMPLPLPGDADLPLPACWCGRRGCVETFLSGPGLAADHLRHSGSALRPEAIVHAAEAGDAAAEAALQRFEARLARALAQIINILDPDVIVLGGGLSRLSRLYQNVPAQWTAHVFSDVCGTRLKAAIHGDASGVRGAAWLWPAD